MKGGGWSIVRAGVRFISGVMRAGGSGARGSNIITLVNFWGIV